VSLAPGAVDGFVFRTRNLRPPPSDLDAVLLGPGLGDARCIDAERLADVAQCPIAAPFSGDRQGCRYAPSGDISTYDTCPRDCVYRHAVADRDRAVANFRDHDPEPAVLRA